MINTFDQIEQERVKQGLTISQLAKSAGITRQYYNILIVKQDCSYSIVLLLLSALNLRLAIISGEFSYLEMPKPA